MDTSQIDPNTVLDKMGDQIAQLSKTLCVTQAALDKSLADNADLHRTNNVLKGQIADLMRQIEAPPADLNQEEVAP